MTSAVNASIVITVVKQQILGIRQTGKAVDSESIIYWFETSMPNFRLNPIKWVLINAGLIGFLFLFKLIYDHYTVVKTVARKQRPFKIHRKGKSTIKSGAKKFAF